MRLSRCYYFCAHAWAGAWMCAIALVTLPPPTFAQEDTGLTATEALAVDEAAASSERSWRGDFNVRIGLLAALGPEYEGSNDYELEPVPYLRINWKDRVIFSGRALEANLINADGVRLGPLLRTRGGRDNDNDRALTGLGDVDRAVEAGTFVRVDRGPWQMRLNATQDVAGGHEGLLVEMGGGVRIPLTKPWFNLRFTTTWANDRYMQSFYSVGLSAADRSGLPSFDAQSGFKDIGVRLGSQFKLTPHWALVGSLGYERLLGHAADSPLVAERGDPDQFFIALGGMYRF